MAHLRSSPQLDFWGIRHMRDFIKCPKLENYSFVEMLQWWHFFSLWGRLYVMTTCSFTADWGCLAADSQKTIFPIRKVWHFLDTCLKFWFGIHSMFLRAVNTNLRSLTNKTHNDNVVSWKVNMYVTLWSNPLKEHKVKSDGGAEYVIDYG